MAVFIGIANCFMHRNQKNSHSIANYRVAMSNNLFKVRLPNIFNLYRPTPTSKLRSYFFSESEFKNCPRAFK